MQRSHRFIAIAIVTSGAVFAASRGYAQRANIDFTSKYASSTVRIAPTAIGYDGVVTPVMFNPEFSHNPKLGEDFSFVITSAPISIKTCRSVTVDLQESIAIYRNLPKSGNPNSSNRDDSESSFGWLKTNVEIVDAKSGTLLRKEMGILASLDKARPGDDTSATRRLNVDLSNIQVENVILRFSGISMFSYNVVPRITINNSLGTEIDQVH